MCNGRQSQESFKKVKHLMTKKTPEQEAESNKTIFTNFAILPVARPIQKHTNDVIHGVAERSLTFLTSMALGRSLNHQEPHILICKTGDKFTCLCLED